MSIRKLAKEARERRLESNKKDNNELPIHSYCFDNSYVVYTILKENNYNPKIVEGTTEWYAQEFIEEGISIEELESVQEMAGLVHYWVEVDNKIIDISSHSNANFGDILITDELPDTYYRFSDSYKEGERTLKNAMSKLCNYCGGRKNYCGCSQKQ